MAAASPVLRAAYEAHERLLWQLCYRMTGVPADADDLVQETFLRAMERPPARADDELRPWLVRVALNLARDLLRRRRRRRYPGPWLPAPLPTGDDDGGDGPAFEPTIPGVGSTEGRYDLLESVSMAFLVALEALTPRQRAVLLLRDVFDYSVRETAWALDVSEANVKTTHHRARRAMADYDRARRPPSRERSDATRTAIARLMTALQGGQLAAIEAVLSGDVRAVSDAGGEFHAARKALIGPARVALFFRNISQRRTERTRAVPVVLNGLPALAYEFGTGHPGDPPRGALTVQVDDDGRIRRLYIVLATRKLTAVPTD